MAQELDYFWYEDPLAEDDIYAYIKLKQKLDIPILATEHTPGGLYGMADWVRQQATDMLRGDVAVKAGLTPMIRIAHMAEGFRMKCEVHHGGNSLNNVANLHLIMAINNCDYFEVLLPHSANKYALVEEIEVDSEGYAHAPTKPGLYGRNSEGNVMARALLAITDEGGILTFHPYSHSKEIGFDRIVQDFALRLARKMGTLVVADGNVSKLMSTRWYDDGPVDLTRQFESLEDGSSFREDLRHIAPDQVLQAMQCAIAPLSFNDLTLPLLINLPELDERPELVDVLFPLVCQNSKLPTDSLVRIANLLIDAGRDREVERLVPRLVNHAFMIDWMDEYGNNEIVGIMAKVAPSKALRFLRETRSAGVRSWEQEWNGYRLGYGAVATQRLHRPRQAAKLLELALQRNPNLKNSLEEQFKALVG